MIEGEKKCICFNENGKKITKKGKKMGRSYN